MCDSHRGFRSSQEGGVAVAERPKQKPKKQPLISQDPPTKEQLKTMLDIAQAIAPGVDTISHVGSGKEYRVPVTEEQDPSQRRLKSQPKEEGGPQAPVAKTTAETKAAAQAALAAPAPAKTDAFTPPKPTTAPRKVPPKTPAAPAKLPQPAPAPKKPELAPAAQTPVYRPPVQPTETPEARKLRRVMEMLASVCEREKRGSLTPMALHQAINGFVNLLGTPMVNPNAPMQQRIRTENIAKAALANALRGLKIDEALWPRFLRR
ncbi:MAG: hypothetical protein PHE68_01305 [Candidatus Peribacteraceae bacterium]|nr:hypothetical protein [Candidatus Peribacteraceae bacterium]MDD5074575.1 hypothetical protein [Candidatus Peribacteraceae bacterium]